MNHDKNDIPRQEPEEAARRKRQRPRRTGEGGEAVNRRWLFVLIDVLLLVAILLSVLFIVSLLTPFSLFGSSKTAERTVTYAVEIAGVDSATVDALSVGDTVRDAATGHVIGTVAAIDIGGYEEFTNVPTAEQDDELGSYVVTRITYPDTYKTLTVTITATAAYSEGVGYTVEDCRIAVGRSYDLRFPVYAATGVCVRLAAE